MPTNLFTIHKHDAREIKSLIKEPLIDVTITSPPYYEMKDYGYEEQIGFGQTYDNYLNDLKTVFQGVFDATKETGTLWVIIDTFRKNGEMVTLPFDFANKIKEIGWKLQEVIIWKKDKTVPWAHKGQMRNLFEYILMFSKSNNYNFFVDDIRDYESLKKWWVKYPERYNPKGKTPEAIWDFPIPTQGSWGDGYIRHFCPLPEEMIAQILHLTTRENDVVCDPFSGSGAVLAKADNMKRRYIGTELNDEYIQMFKDYLEKTQENNRHRYEANQKYFADQVSFERLILDLRSLKYARLFYKELKKKDIKSIQRIRVDISDEEPIKNNAVLKVEYKILVSNEVTQDERKSMISFFDEIIIEKPLSKFGIEPSFQIVSTIEQLTDMNDPQLYVYTDRVSHKFARSITIQDLHSLKKSELIVSPIMVNLNEKDYE